MINGIPINMIRNDVLFFLFTLASVISAIRVDWNTNKGPILPPTTTVPPPAPRGPFREPSPVWENQDDDVPNPDPYRYILPPPSRPKLETDNYARATTSPKKEVQQKQPNYGKVISKYPDGDVNTIKRVPTLAVQYIPNIGFRYNAVVPVAPSKVHNSKDSDYYHHRKYYKSNGLFNPKTKKFKAYEKVKFVPQLFVFAPVHQQELPYLQTPQPFTSQQYSTIRTTQQSPYQNEGQVAKHWSQKSSYFIPNTFAQSTKSQR